VLPGIVDAHAHLQHEVFAHDRDAVLDRARAAGLVRILVPGWDRRSSEAALELAAAHPDLIDAAVGVHPHDAATTTPTDWVALEALAADPAARAIGEIGAVLIVSGAIKGQTETATIYILTAFEERLDAQGNLVALSLAAVSILLLVAIEASKRRRVREVQG